MGIKNFVKKIGQKAAGGVTKLATLSPAELEKIESLRDKYLNEMPNPTDENAIEMTDRLLAAASTIIYNAYLPQLKGLYIPVQSDAEYEKEFRAENNIRYLNITKWVTDSKENSLEKLVNVYGTLSYEECNIALVFNRRMKKTNVYLAVVNTNNSISNVEVNNYISRISSAIRGNFPGSEWSEVKEGKLPCFENNGEYSVAIASNIPAEKSEKFVSQTIEKLLDGYVPNNTEEEYTVILLATPILDVESRKLKLSAIYSSLYPYSSWNTNYTYNENGSVGSSATVGLNIGASIGRQSGTNSTISDSAAETYNASTSDSRSDNISDAVSQSATEGSSITGSVGGSVSTGITGTTTAGVGINGGPFSASLSQSVATNVTGTISTNVATASSNSVSNAVSKTISTGRTIANTIGKAVSATSTVANGVSNAMNCGANFGANFARTSSVNQTIGKNEGITQNHINHNIKHALEIMDEQIQRYDQATAMGMWDFAAYVISEDMNMANNVAHSYLSLTQGEKSYSSKIAVNLWRGDMGEESGEAKEICKYLKNLRHPLFGLNPEIIKEDNTYIVYPPVVNATTNLSGKELAFSLNFPRKSIAGLPVMECAEFGRNISTYSVSDNDEKRLNIGKVFHMHREENTQVELTMQSLTSHVFVTGSTGAGKSNTVYKIIDECRKNNVNFLVVEPAKGEYKHVFGNDKDVRVLGTNPDITPLLRINPFSFPKGIHVLEHVDRLVEIFNVCWPMYAAMPAVLKRAIEDSYKDCGWNLTESTNNYGEYLFPDFADVARNICAFIDNSEYDNDNKGAYKGSLLTRLQSLTTGLYKQIFANNELSPEQLFENNVIIDLSRVGSTETRSMIMGMIILKLQEYRLSKNDMSNSKLKHITILEEAHNILKNSSQIQSGESASLAGKSVEMIGNAIAEMRTFGEGFVIVDQAPGLLDMAAIRNTNTKIIMRLPDLMDRELVGKAANLNEEQIKELSKLPCGVAAVYQNEWIEPVLCKVDCFNANSETYHYTAEKVENAKTDEKNGFSVLKKILTSEKISKEVIVKECKPMLEKMGLRTSTKTAILNLLENPSNSPKMTKIATIAAELLPSVMDKVRCSFNQTPIPKDWTVSARETLRRAVGTNEDMQLENDIIQALMTEHLLHELKNPSLLEKWSLEGELHDNG